MRDNNLLVEEDDHADLPPKRESLINLDEHHQEVETWDQHPPDENGDEL
jgi:hypothetical protein